MKKTWFLSDYRYLFACAMKILKIMRLTIFIVVVSAFQTLALSSYAQNQKIELKLTKATITEVLEKIEDNTDFFFFYNNKGLPLEKIVSLDLKDKTINEVLDVLFKGTNVSYTINNRQIILTGGETGSVQQSKTVTGKVTDSSGATLPGVSVIIKGTTNGTTSDFDGNYTLANVPGDAALIFSFVGMKSMEISVAGKTTINVKMEDETIGIEEVVAVGYGTQVKREITGSIATIGAEKLDDQPVNQFSQLLQGRIAGVQIAQVNGQPGRGMAFRIRGAASLSAGNAPLFVIDGLPISGDINNINPEEIETFSVLKDASATALYGSRASNGVILITTKHAKSGESKITLDAYSGIQQIPENKVPKMMNARQYAQYMYDRYQDALTYEKSVPPLNAAYANPEAYGEGTNWFKVITQTAPIQSYNLSILSSKEKSSSAVIVGYSEQKGVLVNTGTQLFSLRINNDYHFFNDKLNVGFNLAPSYRMDHNNRLTTDGLTGLFLYALEASPIGVPVNPDGSYPYNVNTPGMVTNVNPYSQLKNRQDDFVTTRLIGNGYANYEFLPGLLLKTNIGVDQGIEFYKNFSPSILASSGIATGSSKAYDTYSWTAEANLQYNKTFKDHSIEALVGYSAQKYNSFSNAVGGQGFPSDDIPYLSAASTITSGASYLAQYSLLSAIGRINYSYKSKYLLSCAIRNDGSSRFGPNKKYGSFPSISAGWIVSDEDFLKGINAVNFLKIRASYGITGNNNIGNYTYISSIGSNINYFANKTLYPGATITSLGNDDLAWERNKQLDLGFDLILLNNRVTLEYDYYHKITDGMIQSRPVPRASGFSALMFNTGEFEFWGHELSIKTVTLIGNLKWNNTLNISIDRNKIKSLVSPGYIDYGSTGASNYYRNQVGHPLSMFYGYVFDGLYKDDDDLANSPNYKGGSTISDVGTIKFKDLNNDGVVEDVNDRTFVGNPTPDLFFGMTNDFLYKNFDLSISVSGQVGGDLLNVNKWTHLVNMDGARNLLAEAADRWRSPSNPGSGIYPRTKTNTTAIGRYTNSQWVENGTYLTVKNISLGYTFNFRNKNIIKGFRVFGAVQQAFVLTGYTGMNPEANLSGLDGTRGIGIDVSSYPVPRTFAIGVSANFK